MQRLGIYVCMIAALAIHVAETQAQHYGGGGGLNGRRRPTGTIGLAGAEGVQASVPSMSFSGAAGQADLPGQSGPRSRPSVLGASGNISAGNRSKASMAGVQSDRAQVGRAALAPAVVKRQLGGWHPAHRPSLGTSTGERGKAAAVAI